MRRRLVYPGLVLAVVAGLAVVGSGQHKLWESQIQVQLKIVTAKTGAPVACGYALLLDKAPDVDDIRPLLQAGDEAFLRRRQLNRQPSGERDCSSAAGEMTVVIHRRFSTHRLFSFLPVTVPIPQPLWLIAARDGFSIQIRKLDEAAWQALPGTAGYRQDVVLRLRQ